MSFLYLTPLLALLAGSIVYCVLVVIGAAAYRRSGASTLREWPPVSVLRPLAGAEDNTEAKLHSIFEQRYPDFEVLLSVHDESDPAAAVARRVMAEFPHVSSQLIVAGPSPFPNAKVWSLRALEPLARNEIIVMTDSDIRLPEDGLKTMISELHQNNVGLVTCPYRARGGASFWSRLEALGLNTEFLGGLLTARLLHVMDFAIGCTIATRRGDLVAIGGLETLQRYLAEDFMMGNLTRNRGRKVVLSRCIISHYIGDDGFVNTWKHRLRWARSTRRSRRIGYVGELFTKTTAISLTLWLVAPGAWGLALIGLVFRAWAQWATGVWVLDDPLVARYWWLLPLEDIASFATWVLGFFGNTIVWRGRKLVLARDGSFKEA
ncbi:MAG TPA: bacteriohopanetetrol glucosamine biosynthesis glycosyltransferase HpnI [Bryobacteraceae bacterium]|jgi:ceramide glucosyltransferase|nr:bacteriohopanetetrol glucosamine biosynthesis glycosyltransferase HpnI [Bryobacteraceae bacterium]